MTTFLLATNSSSASQIPYFLHHNDTLNINVVLVLELLLHEIYVT